MDGAANETGKTVYSITEANLMVMLMTLTRWVIYTTEKPTNDMSDSLNGISGEI